MAATRCRWPSRFRPGHPPQSIIPTLREPFLIDRSRLDQSRSADERKHSSRRIAIEPILIISSSQFTTLVTSLQRKSRFLLGRSAARSRVRLGAMHLRRNRSVPDLVVKPPPWPRGHVVLRGTRGALVGGERRQARAPSKHLIGSRCRLSELARLPTCSPASCRSLRSRPTIDAWPLVLVCFDAGPARAAVSGGANCLSVDGGNTFATFARARPKYSR